jgi:predicted O-methyltransferase YrrM
VTVAKSDVRVEAGPRRLLAAGKRRVDRMARSVKHRLVRTFRPLPTILLDQIAPGPVDIVEPILERICLPPYLGATDHDDFSALMRIARAQRPRVIFEFGTAHGNSAANLCRQCPDARVYTVNAPAELQTGASITFELSASEIGRVYRDHGYGGRVTQILQNSLDLNLGDILPGPVVDLAIIDACHDFEYVINDFNKIHPFVSPAGIVLFHDTHPSMTKHLEGSYLACVSLRAHGIDVRHIDGTWWGIWKRDWNPDAGAKAGVGGR